MYAGRVACCPLVSHGEDADETDRQMDGRRTVTLFFLLKTASVVIRLPCAVSDSVSANGRAASYETINISVAAPSIKSRFVTADVTIKTNQTDDL